MTLALRWRHADPPIVTQWRGPDGSLALSALAIPPRPIAALIGPPGPAGPSFNIDTAQIDGGTFN